MTSTKTGIAPKNTAALALAAKVIVETMTSSPGSMPSAYMAACSAAVPVLTATASEVPATAARACSNSPTLGPVVSQSERKVSVTAATSQSSIVCRP